MPSAQAGTAWKPRRHQRSLPRPACRAALERAGAGQAERIAWHALIVRGLPPAAACSQDVCSNQGSPFPPSLESYELRRGVRQDAPRDECLVELEAFSSGSAAPGTALYLNSAGRWEQYGRVVSLSESIGQASPLYDGGEVDRSDPREFRREEVIGSARARFFRAGDDASTVLTCG